MGIRKNQAKLSQPERDAFVVAVKKLKGIKGKEGYDQFVADHRKAFEEQPSPAHFGPGFLPWHREFLLRFEIALQRIDPTVSLPYWDWTVDNSKNSSLWNGSFMGGDGSLNDRDRVTTGPFAYNNDWPLTILPSDETDPFLKRALGRASQLPTSTDVNKALQYLPYDLEPWDKSQRIRITRASEKAWNSRSMAQRTHGSADRWMAAARPMIRCSGCITATSTGSGHNGKARTPVGPTSRQLVQRHSQDSAWTTQCRLGTAGHFHPHRTACSITARSVINMMVNRTLQRCTPRSLGKRDLIGVSTDAHLTTSTRNAVTTETSVGGTRSCPDARSRRSPGEAAIEQIRQSVFT